ncbi:hypothetical protein C8P63_10494 [Melghirimyces profundicolus]|uniref:Uncharacterized protein n=1 Tax=Melghirimyces profundicolus TaxID=1242148 RepID=A0A2T6C4J8_9BACL|nr:hypothetical protein C8P63_10494 [Melghirimyces profundicolus]
MTTTETPTSPSPRPRPEGKLPVRALIASLAGAPRRAGVQSYRGSDRPVPLFLVFVFVPYVNIRLKF